MLRVQSLFCLQILWILDNKRWLCGIFNFAKLFTNMFTEAMTVRVNATQDIG